MDLKIYYILDEDMYKLKNPDENGIYIILMRAGDKVPYIYRNNTWWPLTFFFC